MESFDENEHCKTVFAHAGTALYHAQILEAALQNLLVLASAISGDLKSLTEYDQREEELRTSTLGRLIREFRKDAKENSDAEDTINRALGRRNFLAHHFFKERAVELMGRKGRDSMIEELNSDQNLFIRAEVLISAMGKAMALHLGVTDEKVRAEFERLEQQAE